MKCSGEACTGPDAVYATDGYGFLCLPRGITQKLVKSGCIFEEADAWLDLWCHTVWQDPQNPFSDTTPVIQYGQYGAVLTLETLGLRWNWEKTKVWRFLQKYKDTFILQKLPGSYGCLISNTQYPTGEDNTNIGHTEILRILDGIRFCSQNTHANGTDNERINKYIAWYSQKSAKPGIAIESGDDMSISDDVIIPSLNTYKDAMNEKLEPNLTYCDEESHENMSIPDEIFIHNPNTFFDTAYRRKITGYISVMASDGYVVPWIIRISDRILTTAQNTRVSVIHKRKCLNYAVYKQLSSRLPDDLICISNPILFCNQNAYFDDT